MGICQTDYANQVVFEQQVQAYRLYMMRYLNEYISYRTKAGDWDTKATRDVFTGLEKFTYKPLNFYQSIGNYILLVIAILIWLALSYILIEWASKKTRII